MLLTKSSYLGLCSNLTGLSVLSFLAIAANNTDLPVDLPPIIEFKFEFNSIDVLYI